MGSFVKNNPPKITGIGKRCPSCEFLTSQVYLLTLFAKIKFSDKISGYTVLPGYMMKRGWGQDVFTPWNQIRYNFIETFFFKVYNNKKKNRSQGYKTFSYSTQLSTKFILLINVPIIVGILTFEPVHVISNNLTF